MVNPPTPYPAVGKEQPSHPFPPISKTPKLTQQSIYSNNSPSEATTEAPQMNHPLRTMLVFLNPHAMS